MGPDSTLSAREDGMGSTDVALTFGIYPGGESGGAAKAPGARS